MILQGINYGPVWAASGAHGVFGEGYWFHKFGIPNKKGITFVAKTTTTNAITGHMPLNPVTWQPKEWVPRCIWFDFLRGNALNAVGLSNFGIEAALRTNRWQARTDPFQLSWMPMPGLPDAQARFADARAYVKILKPTLKDFCSPIALQLNISCPNTAENLAELLLEAAELIKILKELGIAIVVKINVTTAPQQMMELHEKESFDGIVISNTMPYGAQLTDDHINWRKLTGKHQSPLTTRGFPAGGMSGHALHPLVEDWVMQAICANMHIPINWCGGIMNVQGARRALASDYIHSISLGTVHMLRPWRVGAITNAAIEQTAARYRH